MIVVTLTEDEYRDACQIANLRDIHSAMRGDKNKGGCRDPKADRTGRGILGACAEFAFCKAMGYTWSRSVDTYKEEPDVAPHWEIRSTERTGQRLIIRPGDDPRRCYVLVEPYKSERTFRIVGYILGVAGMQERFEEDPGGWGKAFFVPREELCPMA